MKLKSTSGRLVHFAGNTVRIDSDLPEIARAIGIHFKNCSVENGPIIANYKITAVNNTDYKVSVDGSDLSSAGNFDQTLWFLIHDIVTRLNGISTTDLVFHAAALALDNRGIILCGQSGSGKSSIAAWLTAIGFQYLTDEVISLPGNGGEISGLCRSIVLKHGSAFIWQRWLSRKDTDDFLHFNDDSVWIEPTLLNNDAVRTLVKPQVLIFPGYVPDAEFQVERLSPANALFHLLQCLVNARNFPDYGMSASTRLVRQVTAYSLIYSNIESAANWIKQITLSG